LTRAEVLNIIAPRCIAPRTSWEDTTAVPRELEDLGRFAEPSLYILVALSEGPKHGYSIKLDVEALSGHPLGPGTLYGALARLERRGLIEALAEDERRRPYRLTAAGEAALDGQLEQIERFVRVGRARLPRTSA
jgi:DNA-binding PadR family transcriptional regulator